MHLFDISHKKSSMHCPESFTMTRDIPFYRIGPWIWKFFFFFTHLETASGSQNPPPLHHFLCNVHCGLTLEVGFHSV